MRINKIDEITQRNWEHKKGVKHKAGILWFLSTSLQPAAMLKKHR